MPIGKVVAMTSAQHTLHQQHHGWDDSLASAVRVAPGEEEILEQVLAEEARSGHRNRAFLEQA
jgi:hypothetical protein